MALRCLIEFYNKKNNLVEIICIDMRFLSEDRHIVFTIAATLHLGCVFTPEYVLKSLVK